MDRIINVFKSYSVIIIILLLSSCYLPTETVLINSEQPVDSMLILILLENNIDTIENTLTLSHNGEVLYRFKESKEYKISVPDDTLVFQWETKHISGRDVWPYVYYLKLDGSGASDTTVSKTIIPVEQNRYRIRGTDMIIDL